MVVLVISAAPQMLALIGDQTVWAVGAFVVISFAAGHLLGGPVGAAYALGLKRRRVEPSTGSGSRWIIA